MAMYSPCFKEVEQVCCHGCCSNPLLFPTTTTTTGTKLTTTSTSSACRKNFANTTSNSFFANTNFTDHESLPSFNESLATFTRTYPKYSDTAKVDQMRGQEYHHLSLSNRICLDYIGIGFAASDAPPGFALLHGGGGSEFEASVRNLILIPIFLLLID
ncbi:hypothetical protein LXL04_008352 [Taraxacum kok-saghyz]